MKALARTSHSYTTYTYIENALGNILNAYGYCYGYGYGYCYGYG